MKKAVTIVTALVAVFMGVGGVLPALAKVRDMGAIPAALVGSYTLGVFLLSAVGAGAVVHLFKSRDIGRRAR